MNRLKDFFPEPPEPSSTDDYFEVESHYDTFAVSRETASDIERWLDQVPAPRWLIFRDLAGSRHRVLSAQIYRVSECTSSQRAAGRDLDRARRREAKADRRPWEDDD